jgi:hypothetical protein
MDASLRFGRRYSLHAMGSRFEFERGVCAATDDPADDLLVAAVFARAFAQNLDFPALGFCEARIHAEQIAGENGGFVSAGAGAHLEENIAVVLRILRDQQALQFQLFGGHARRQAFELFLPHRLGRRILIELQLVGDLEIRFERHKASVALDERR